MDILEKIDKKLSKPEIKNEAKISPDAKPVVYKAIEELMDEKLSETIYNALSGEMEANVITKLSKLIKQAVNDSVMAVIDNFEMKNESYDRKFSRILNEDND